MATTILAGLTTIFTPPPSCSSSWTYEAEIFNSISGGLLLQNALPQFLDTECFPSGFNCAGRAPDMINVFSPGACPIGYTTASELFAGDTTLAACCQSGFSYSSTFSQKDQFNSTSVLFAGCLSTYPLASGSTTVPARSAVDDSGLNYTTVAGPIIMWGQPINIEFRQEDLALFTTSALLTVSPSTSLSRTAGPSNTITQPYSAPTVIATPTSAPSVGLSTGAEAGIGIATGFSGLLILGAIVFVSIRSRSRRNRQPHAEGYTMQPHTGPWEFKELDGSEHYHMRELEGSQSRPPAEMFVSKAYSARTQELE